MIPSSFELNSDLSFQREQSLLAPYATYSCNSRGRKHAEVEHPYRTPFQRDRDRIVHSAAYRRLSGKMQVFTGDMGDYHRTRLTHTLEVASISRTIARFVKLNEDLVEALAYFHDIGHPPFGHAGEDTLDECLREFGGFSHNGYALTLAEELELRYTAYAGLNLTHEVLDSQRFRATKDSHAHTPILEAQVVEAADSITYNAHDCDDGLKLQFIELDELSSVPLVAEALKTVRSRFTNASDDQLRMAVVHELLDQQVGDTLNHSIARLHKEGFLSADEAQQAPFTICMSDEQAEKKGELEEFLYHRIYRHDHIVKVRQLAQEQLQSTFDHFCRDPDKIPVRYLNRPNVAIERAVGDYLAGMTERFFQSLQTE